MRLPVARLLLLVCALLAVVPAAANAATPPKVTSVAPLKLKIGERLTIRGKGFLAGKNRNTVLFKATGARAVFVKAESATSTVLVVKVPTKLAPFLKAATGTRFQLRVLAKRLSAAYTPAKRSPVIAAATATPATTSPAAVTPVASPVANAAPSCSTTAAAQANGDQDGDGMPNGVEIAYGVNPCNPDSDDDGMVDGYEYEAARDLNSHDAGASGRPYPGKRPWPNPLDGTDASDDYDGDGLTLSEEYSMWWTLGHHSPLTQYSDGEQASGGRVLAGASNPLDLNNDRALTDDERDVDNDGLSNVVELHYRGIQGWWSTTMTTEPRYTLRHFADLDPLNRDADLDGVPDGADDQDVDGYNNIKEMQLDRVADPAHVKASETLLLVDPFNPCMPNPHAATCGRYPPAGGRAWRPFTAADVVALPLGTPLPFTVDGSAVPGSTDTWDGRAGLPNS